MCVYTIYKYRYMYQMARLPPKNYTGYVHYSNKGVLEKKDIRPHYINLKASNFID